MSSNRMTLGVMTLVLMAGAPVMAKQQASDYETQLVQQIQQHWRGDKRLHGRQCVELPVHIETDGTVSAVGKEVVMQPCAMRLERRLAVSSIFRRRPKIVMNAIKTCY